MSDFKLSYYKEFARKGKLLTYCPSQYPRQRYQVRVMEEPYIFDNVVKVRVYSFDHKDILVVRASELGVSRTKKLDKIKPFCTHRNGDTSYCYCNS